MVSPSPKKGSIRAKIRIGLPPAALRATKPAGSSGEDHHADEEAPGQEVSPKRLGREHNHSQDENQKRHDLHLRR